MIKTNYHTHTKYCDGRNTAEETVISAIEKGFSILGFSGHSTLENTDWSMSNADTLRYIKDITELKSRYSDKIEILCGIEQDYFSKAPEYSYDFIIGSVHSLKIGDGFLSLDDSADILIDGINKYFDGDPIKLCKAYYETVADVSKKTNCDVIGHLDLITKFNETHHIFDTADPRYLDCAKDAVKALSDSRALFEVNTGAMSRGLRTAPYPQKELLEYIETCGCDVILSSDCHQKENLDYGFETALKLIKSCGFKRLAYISDKEIKYEIIR